MTDTAQILPKLRFPEFENDGEWKVVKLGDVFKRITDKNKENNNNVLTISAQNGLVSQYDYFNKNVAANDVTGYYLIKTGDFAYNKSRSQGYPYGAIKPLKLYDKGVVSTLYICFRTKEQNSCIDFYEHYFETDLIHNEIGKIAQEGARNHGLLNISTEDFFEKISLYIPSLPEQQKIAAFLTSLDEQISAHTKKLEALKAHKKGLMQQLFPANNEKTPKLRFPEFKNDGEWKEVRLGEIAKRITLKNKDNKPLPALTNSASRGIVKQEDYFDREIVSKDNLINYYIVSDDDFVYNPRISTIAPVGPISSNKIGEGVMSPLYTVFRFVEGDVDFFEHYFKTNNWHQYLKDKANFGARFDRMNISTEDFMGLPIPFPPLPEQQKIASFLSSIDEMIQTQDDKIRKLKTYKNGLMQQMFPQNK